MWTQQNRVFDSLFIPNEMEKRRSNNFLKGICHMLFAHIFHILFFHSLLDPGVEAAFFNFLL